MLRIYQVAQKPTAQAKTCQRVCLPQRFIHQPLLASMKKNADIKKMVVFVGNNDKKWG